MVSFPKTDRKRIKKDDTERGFSAYRLALLGIFLAVILAVGLFERMIPLDFAVPGVRLGLSNVVILLAVYRFRFGSVLLLVIMKCVLLAALTGGMSSFLYSVCGSLLSFAVMWLLVKGLKEKIGPIGVSTAGAVCHIAGQLLVASLIIENLNLFVFLPLLILLGGASGVLVGVLVKLALRVLPR